MLRTVRQLRTDLAGMADADKCGAVVERLTPVQRDIVPAFLAGRTAMVGALGLAGYAQAMERFAAGERAVNRAWSCAADGFADDLDELLERAEMLLAEAAHRLSLPGE